MAQLISVLLLSISLSLSVFTHVALATDAQKAIPGAKVTTSATKTELHWIAQTAFPGSTSFEGVRFGGISGIAFRDGRLVLISDDRGKYGEPRFYEADLLFQKNKFELRLTKKIQLVGVPGNGKKRAVLDLESLVWFSDGSFAMASEADTNRKPREENRLLLVSAVGKFQDEVDLPKEVQPNPTGRQIRGTANNSGPEGLSLCDDGSLWMGMERPLLGEGLHNVRLDRYQKTGDKWNFSNTISYPLSKTGPYEVMRGVSEILCRGKDHFLVLERFVQVSPGSGVRVDGEIFDFKCVEEVCEKTAVIMKAPQALAFGNIEALSWGPPGPLGEKTLLVASDNNFGSDSTELWWFSFKETP